jgi:cysteine-rich repeat protein
VCIPIVCGNGFVQQDEQCDDGDTSGGDGCSATCMIEPGFTCSGQPSVCVPIVCGNGVVQPGEECDDGNTAAGDCCQPDCTLDPAGTGCEAPVPFPGTCDGNGNCVGIPTLSEWGVAALSLLMLGAVLRDRRRAMGPVRR